MKAARIKSDQLLEMKKPRQNSIDIDEVRRIFKQNAGRKKSLYDILLDYNTSKDNHGAISLSTFRRFVKRKKIATFKKPLLRSENVDSETSKQKRTEFQSAYLTEIKKESDTYFVDESTFSSRDFQGKMWLPVGSNQPVKFKSKIEKLNVFCGVSATKGVFLKPITKNGNKYEFACFLKDLSTKFVYQDIQDDSSKRRATVYVDNSSIHKGLDMQELASSLGLDLIFLSPYSPEYNAAENVFALLKAEIRKLGVKSGSITKPFQQ